MSRFSACLLALAAASPCLAQDTIPAAKLKDVSAIRVMAPSLSERPLTGQVTAADRTGLVLASGDSTIRIPREDVAALQRSVRGSRARSALGWGVVGGITGYVAVHMWLNRKYENDENNGFGAILVGFPVGATAGALLGAWKPRSAWVPMRVREWL
jgi:hypothetical protein